MSLLDLGCNSVVVCMLSMCGALGSIHVKHTQTKNKSLLKQLTQSPGDDIILAESSLEQ